MYDPKQEQEAGNIRIEGITYLDGHWIDAYSCTCCTCGTQLRVEEREYHYTWWGWKIASPSSTLA
jgi:hypothetical protein